MSNETTTPQPTLAEMQLHQYDALLEAQERERAHNSALAIVTQLVGMARQGLSHDAGVLSTEFKALYAKINPFLVEELARLRRLAQENLTAGKVEAVPAQNPTLPIPEPGPVGGRTAAA